MSLLDNLTAPARILDEADHHGEAVEAWQQVLTQLAGQDATIEDLQESLADIELSMEDIGWVRLESWAEQQLSAAGIRSAARVGMAAWLANPLIKRGLNLRAMYVWGGGVTISAKDPDVNEVLQGFLDDPETRKNLTSASARQANERTLGTAGNLFVALWTSPVTGRVTPRLVPLEEIAEVIKNPEDRGETWLFKRVTTNVAGNVVTTYHPDVRYQPAARAKVIGTARDKSGGLIDAGQVVWEAPVAQMKVNALPDWDFGVGDAFTAVTWARLYQEFLADWAKLVKALSRFAWKATSDRKGAAQKAVDRITQQQASDYGPAASQAGQTTSMVGVNLEAIPKTGATIDSESGRPLSAMIAAALDVPVTMLLADPGVTGARATAQTLDTPTELMAGTRRSENEDFLRLIFDHVVDSSVTAPRGALSGGVERDEFGRRTVTLAGDAQRTVEFSWPDLTDTPIDLLLKAIQAADDIDKLPPLVIARLLLAAFQVSDADEILEELTDEDGNYVPPSVSAGDAAVAAFNAGQDPAARLNDGNSGGGTA